MKSRPELKDKLWSNVTKLQDGLKSRGFDIGETSSAVTPIYMKGTVPQATNLIFDLRENFDIFCSVVVYPVVPKGTILLRLIPTSVHTDEDINESLEAFEKVQNKLASGAYDSEKIIAT